MTWRDTFRYLTEMGQKQAAVTGQRLGELYARYLQVGKNLGFRSHWNFFLFRNWTRMQTNLQPKLDWWSPLWPGMLSTLWTGWVFGCIVTISKFFRATETANIILKQVKFNILGLINLLSTVACGDWPYKLRSHKRRGSLHSRATSWDEILIEIFTILLLTF